jgi:hypothetical protein
MGTFKSAFKPEQEQEIDGSVQAMENRLFGLTRKCPRKLCYKLGKNELLHGFNTEDISVGSNWLKDFLNLHVKLTLRKPEPMSAAQVLCFNKATVSPFF